MEVSSDFVVAAEDLEEDNVHCSDGESKKRSSLDKHVLLFPPTSDSTYNLGTPMNFEVGRFYKIDHSNLPANCPVQIKCVNLVMVCDKGEKQVSLRYPSLHSLRTHFNDQSFGKPEGKKIPALDEKYVMGIEFAIKTLCRSIIAKEFAEKRNSWSFWVSPTNSPVINDGATGLVSKQGSCWSELKFTGLVQWGQRRQVRFLGRHEEQKVETLPQLQKEKGVIFKPREGTNVKKRKNVEKEEMEAVKVAPFEEQRMTRQYKKNQQGVVSSSSGAKKFKKNHKGVVSSSSRDKNSEKTVKDSKKQELVVYARKKGKVSIDRWAAERYKLAEENMLKIMKEKGAVYGNSIMRQELRSEARKYIGDTGLLDHLLKHMAGKVAPGGVERFRRRHNAEGSMEYWLESADLADMRKEMGVQDSYWTPPPGWKPGDSISPDHVTSNQLREIKDEIIKLKREMRELTSKRDEEALAIVTTPSSCFSSLNFEDYGSQVSKQEIYVELIHKKAKIEEQLKEISLALNGMEDQMGMLKPTLKEPMSESLTPPALLLGPTSLEENMGEETESVDTQMVVGSRAAKDKAAKIERLKSGFQICKPRGTFMWPNISLSPHVLTNLDEHSVVPTPTSASSSTTSAPKLVTKSQTQNLSLSIPMPSSLVKPLAEKCPVSTATLTYVTGPFSPHLSPPLETTETTIITKNGSSINLNETPFGQE